MKFKSTQYKAKSNNLIVSSCFCSTKHIMDTFYLSVYKVGGYIYNDKVI